MAVLLEAKVNIDMDFYDAYNDTLLGTQHALPVLNPAASGITVPGDPLAESLFEAVRNHHILVDIRRLTR